MKGGGEQDKYLPNVVLTIADDVDDTKTFFKS